MRISIAQLDPVVGDIDGNILKLKKTIEDCAGNGSELVVFPELYLTGYPPRDLLDYRGFIRRVERGVASILDFSRKYPGTAIIFGSPSINKNTEGKGLYNSAYFVLNGRILHIHHKMLLPTYDVFDESRYFDVDDTLKPVEYREFKIGITVCEDAWNDPEYWPVRRLYRQDPVAILVKRGADLLINISASPFNAGKEVLRYNIFINQVKRHRKGFLFVNQVGGNDELIFDGRSFYIKPDGNPAFAIDAFEEKVFTFDTENPGKNYSYKPIPKIESIFKALVLGVRDYMKKTGFKKAVVGLSGGIDSSVTACIAVEALGAENVFGVLMPSQYSSEASKTDAQKLAENLGIEIVTVGIRDIFQSYLNILGPHFEGLAPDITEENIQARIRGNILMAFSNKFGHILLSTGNKSELAVGYCTLYGDMSGGLAVISDVPKTMVYELGLYINREREIIPRNVFIKPPSAELRPDQTDQDTLPPYEILDKILELHIEQSKSSDEIIELGFDEKIVRWVVGAVARNEYKRKQAAVGLKVTTKAFGIGRRMPIAARYGL